MHKPLIFGSLEANAILAINKALLAPKRCPFCASDDTIRAGYTERCETCGAIGPNTAPWSWQSRDLQPATQIRHIIIRHSPDATRTDVWPDADWELAKQLGLAAKEGEHHTIITMHNQQCVSTKTNVTKTDIANAKFWGEIT